MDGYSHSPNPASRVSYEPSRAPASPRSSWVFSRRLLLPENPPKCPPAPPVSPKNLKPKPKLESKGSEPLAKALVFLSLLSGPFHPPGSMGLSCSLFCISLSQCLFSVLFWWLGLGLEVRENPTMLHHLWLYNSVVRLLQPISTKNKSEKERAH